MSEATLPAGFLSEAVQLCTVTRDYRKAIAGFLKLGIGPRQVHRFGPATVSEMTYRGTPSSHVMMVCLARLGRMFS
jgi:methylmalonyl-CoA/ethylmalonyl-CoA epimerase